TEPRGEFVLVLEGYTPEDVPPPSEDDLVALWQKKQEAGLSKSAAAKEIAKEFSLSKHEVYDLIKDL
ncbi:MAG: 16S rRNA (cytidine(1402)-2'-O)-methyltransferase, partial [Clostridia bacterium]|nr:16S rRNA (cytidine(1402)-2'-O)-methyltransferase [Clostridia bacterium]